MEPVKKKQKHGADGKEGEGPSVAVPRESLLEACKRGATEQEVRSLLEAGEGVVDIHQADGSGRTALMWACSHGHQLGVIRALITERHAAVNRSDGFGETPLFIACEHGRVEVVRYLVAEAHAAVNQAMNDGATPLFYACCYGHLELVRYLIAEAHAAVNQAAHDGEAPLYGACRGGHLEVVRYLVTEAHADVNQANNDGDTPLYIAADRGYFGVIRHMASASARLTRLDSAVWQNEQVLRALVQGCQDRLRPLLPSFLEDALVLPVGQGGLEPFLLPMVLEYALPATWEDVQELLC